MRQRYVSAYLERDPAAAAAQSLGVPRADHAQSRAEGVPPRPGAQARGPGLDLVYEELSECVSAREQVEQTVDAHELAAALNDFLAALPARKRKLFVRRYWYADSISDIAARMDMSEGSVSVTLHRLRADLRAFLSERGFAV